MSLNAEQQRFLRLILTNTRIIAAALISGVIVFLAVVVFVIKPDPPQGSPLHTYIALGFGALALVFSFVIPGFVGAPIIRALVAGKRVELPPQLNAHPDVGSAGNLLFLYQTRLIIGYAILEGAAFYNLIAHMIERQQVSLAMVGLLLAAMLVKFPTRGKLESWLTAETRSIDELRSLGPNKR